MQVAGFDPDVVVLEFIGNYRSFGDPGLPGVDINTPAFYAAWQAEARELTVAARARGADVYWVLGPSVGITAQWRDRVHVLAGGYRRLGEELCGIGYVDAFALLGDPWSPSPRRNPDGVHLTGAGGAALAHAIFERVTRRR
jgi:lysophospholipase L1-like esterase